jgi:hypothetical protein
MNLDHILSMAHSPIYNYTVPGLTSWLIGTPNKKTGCVRLLHSERQTTESPVPHNHRFDLSCHVLKGTVKNRIWRINPHGDEFTAKRLIFKGNPGKYGTVDEQIVYRYDYSEATYTQNAPDYSMPACAIHTIYFGRDTYVLFFEGPTVADESIVLQPYVNEKTLPTFRVEDWMFKQ